MSNKKWLIFLFIHPSSLSGLLVAFVVLVIQSIFSIVLPDIPDPQLYAKPKDGNGAIISSCYALHGPNNWRSERSKQTSKNRSEIWRCWARLQCSAWLICFDLKFGCIQICESSRLTVEELSQVEGKYFLPSQNIFAHVYETWYWLVRERSCSLFEQKFWKIFLFFFYWRRLKIDTYDEGGDMLGWIEEFYRNVSFGRFRLGYNNKLRIRKYAISLVRGNRTW